MGEGLVYLRNLLTTEEEVEEREEEVKGAERSRGERRKEKRSPTLNSESRA